MGNACCQTTQQNTDGVHAGEQRQLAVDNLPVMDKTESAQNPHAPAESVAIFDSSQIETLERAFDRVKTTFPKDYDVQTSDPELPILGPYRERGVAYNNESVPTDSLYRGQYKNGLKHGAGLIYWENGNTYYGQFSENKVNGIGVMIYKDGSTYSGQWRDDRANGQGIFRDEEGVMYDGQWVDDNR